MSDENGTTGTTEPQYPGLNEQVIAAVREALAAGYALAPAPRVGIEPRAASTPLLGLVLPVYDEPADVAVLNGNFTILDNSVTATQVATLTNKTLTAPIITNPTITGWTNAQHNHLDAPGAGQLDGGAIVSGDIGTGFLVRETYVAEYLNAGPDLVDAVVRDTLFWGPIGAGAPDASIKRLGAGTLRTSNHLGVGVDPAAWGVNEVVVQVGPTSFRSGGVTSNSYYDGATNRAINSAAATSFTMGGGIYCFYTAPSVAAGAVQTFTQRLLLGTTGTLTLASDVGVQALDLQQQGTNIDGVPSVMIRRTTPASQHQTIRFQNGISLGDYDIGRRAGSDDFRFMFWNGSSLTDRVILSPQGTLTLNPSVGVASISASPGRNLDLQALGGNNITVDPLGNYFYPNRHNIVNCGHPSVGAWGTVYAYTGTVQPSAGTAKSGITPLDPAACYQAAKDVRWYEFAYLPPVYREPEPSPDVAYDAGDDNETKAEKKALRDEAEAQAREAHARMLVETAPARHQRGFVFPTGAEEKDEAGGALPPVPDLFGLGDRQSTTPQTDLATLGCALQEVIRRLEALEAAQAPAPASTTRRRAA